QPRPGQTAAMMAEFALSMLTTLERLNQTLETPFQIRIGIHTGPVIAGVIGVNKLIDDVWGETVNRASRLEAHGLPGRIHISEATRRALAAEYECEPRGLIEVKGMGKIRSPRAGRSPAGAERPGATAKRSKEDRVTPSPDPDRLAAPGRRAGPGRR